MTAVGGSIESVSIDGREFPVAADADSNRKLGGFENATQMNGNGTARLIKTRIPNQVNGLSLEIDDTRGDQEYLQEKANLKRYFVFTVTYASGITYEGDSQIEGEAPASSQSVTAPMNFSGPGTLVQQ